MQCHATKLGPTSGRLYLHVYYRTEICKLCNSESTSVDGFQQKICVYVCSNMQFWPCNCYYNIKINHSLLMCFSSYKKNSSPRKLKEEDPHQSISTAFHVQQIHQQSRIQKLLQIRVRSLCITGIEYIMYTQKSKNKNLFPLNKVR